ncbi:hypothetical protein HPB48_018140 [Haemaphysalis longicornis]|uniref:Cullin N-terminal domain-containing protein n=1 Tax=Haemaphysalis longicornis TaxID=44386 RepID=A0A9J6FUD1_HAELO|nr:hypothetical protein HPB48_018140 [Haemaphysalis longicornis]
MAAGGEPVAGDINEPPEEAQAEKVWGQLLEGIRKVYSSNRTGMSKGDYMRLYSCVYNYAVNTSWHSIMTKPPTGMHPELSSILELYERIKHFLATYLEGHSGKKVDLMNDNVLRFYVSAWEEYRFSSTVLDGICDFVNRTWTERMQTAGQAQFFRIYDLTLILWNRYIISKFKEQITNSVLRLIEKARTERTLTRD